MTGVVGPFALELPEDWGVVADGGRAGVVVLDPLPQTPELGPGGARANVVLRFFPEGSGGGVGAASYREAMAEHALRAQSVLLAYEHAVTESGLAVRRQHWALWLGATVVHSVRWYVGAGADVLEVTLTFDDSMVPAQLWETVAQVVASVRAAGVDAAPEEDLPVAARERVPEAILAIEAPVLRVAESVDGVHEGTAVTVRMPWSQIDADTAEWVP